METNVREFASACRSAYVNRGIDTVEKAILECSEQCVRSLGPGAKIEGISTTAMPDQTIIVAVLASRSRSEPAEEEE